MKFPAFICAMLLSIPVFAGESCAVIPLKKERRYSLELGMDTAVVLGVQNINNYLLAPQILSLTLVPRTPSGEGRWQAQHAWQLGVAATPFIEGPESLYSALVLGRRVAYGPKDANWSVELTARFGAGWLDSQDAQDAQGQDFTFMTAISLGVRYRFSEEWSLFAGGMWHHLSNAGLSEPERRNTGLDAFGPTIGIHRKF